MAVNQHKKEFITLREAAEISGYSADYIGQLIRSGKLEGKQIFSNVSWVTTRDAVADYTQKDKRAKKADNSRMHEYVQYFHSPDFLVKIYTLTGWTVVVVLAIFALLLAYIFSVSVDHRINANYLEKIEYAR